MKDSSEIYESATRFLDQIFQCLDALKISVEHFELDHICYRVSSLEAYERTKLDFGKIAILLHEAQIAGRPISTFKLIEPIHYRGRVISCIELPAPKTSKPMATGWEHAEFVIEESFEQFAARHAHVKFNWAGVRKAHNPELEIELQGCAVKFHHTALEDLVSVEKAIDSIAYDS